MAKGSYFRSSSDTASGELCEQRAERVACAAQDLHKRLGRLCHWRVNVIDHLRVWWK